MLYSMHSRMSMFPKIKKIKMIFKTLALILRRSKIVYDDITMSCSPGLKVRHGIRIERGIRADYRIRINHGTGV